MSGAENTMSEPRPAASLTGSLLARRGAARPAMRRAAQLAVAPAHEDLGWNDMGDEDAAAPLVVKPTLVSAVATIAEPIDTPGAPEAANAPAPRQAAPHASPIVEQLAVLAARIKTSAPRKKAQGAKAATLGGTSRKAAFTLRLDAERHLRLRLLSAMTHRSSQQLLVEALDALIAQDQQLRDLAEQIEAGQVKAVRA